MTASIPSNAFCNYSGLTSVTIPDRVTSIGIYAFYRCSSLTSIYFKGDAPSVYSASNTYPSFQPSVTIYYVDGMDGWTSPEWMGYSTAAWDPESLNRIYINVSFSYNPTAEDAEKTYAGLTYKDEWLTQDSYTYNHDLATMSLGLAMAGFESTTDDDANIKKLYSGLGFDEDTYYSIGYGSEDSDSVAMAISSKDIDAADGSTVKLVAVTLRGGGYGDGGWVGNFDVGSSGAYHNGFNKAAVYALGQIRSYMDYYDIDPAAVHIWLTGYSRSAATANLLSAKLRLNGLCRKDNIYTYTFATPSNQIISCFTSQYDNIFNIVNPLDIVPQVPLLAWNFGKQGTTYQLPCAQTADNGLYVEFLNQFENITGVYYSSVGMETEYILDTLADSFDSRTAYAAYLEDALEKMMTGDYSGIDNILCEKTTVEEIKGYFEEGTKLAYLTASAKLLSAYNYRRDTWGEDDPYIELIKDLAENVKYAGWEQLLGDIGYSNTRICKFLLDAITKGSSSAAMVQHWPEVYLSWMLTAEESDFIDLTSYKVARVSCPVDVDIYDADGNLVARTVTETFEDDGTEYTVSVVDEENTTLEAYVFGEDKVFVLPDGQEYDVVITTNGKYAAGDTMDISVVDYSGGEAVRATTFEAVALDTDSEFSAVISASSAGTQDYMLEDGEVPIQPSSVEELVSAEAAAITNLDIELAGGTYLISGELPELESDATVVFALYGDSGRMLAIDSQTIAAAGEDRTVSGSLTAKSGAGFIRIFAIENNSLVPLNSGGIVYLN